MTKNKLFGVGLAVAALLFCILALFKTPISSAQLYPLNNMEFQFKALNKSLNDLYENKTFSQKELEAINLKLNSLQDKLADIKNESKSNVRTRQLEITTAKINERFEEIKRIVKQNKGEKNYLGADQLPFQVTSIDIISDQPYAVINFDNHIIPITVGDLLANWRVNNISYDANQVEFSNSKNELILVKLSDV